MYYPLNKILDILNPLHLENPLITESDILMYRSIKHIKYSESTNKYDLDSIFEKRTLSIGIEEYLTVEEYNTIIEYMKDYSSLKFKIFNDMQKGKENYSHTGTNRKHRTLVKSKNQFFNTMIADTILSSAIGLYKSTTTWRNKKIENLQNKINSIEEDLEDLKDYNNSQNNKNKHPKYLKGKKKKLAFLQNKLKETLNKEYLPVHFGKNKLLSQEEELKLPLEKQLTNKEEYRNSRLEFAIDGMNTGKGNSLIRIEYDKNSKTGYSLKIFNKKILDFKIPNSHKKWFNLNISVKQSSRISFNDKGKLVLHITYNYLKPIPISKTTKSKGMVGIDIGPKGIDICLVKKDGNPYKYQHFPIGDLLDKRTDDTLRCLSNVIDEILNISKLEGFYDITIENLEFKEDYRYKSNGLPRSIHGTGYKLNRMLSKFPYRIFESLIISKCNRKGFTLKQINPAFTSVIGIFKYSNRDNLSISHNAKSHDLSASLVIGRRGLGFKEKAIVSLRISSVQVSLPIAALLTDSEKQVSKCKSKKQGNWYLWRRMWKKYRSLDNLQKEIMNYQCKLKDHNLEFITDTGIQHLVYEKGPDRILNQISNYTDMIRESKTIQKQTASIIEKKPLKHESDVLDNSVNPHVDTLRSAV